MNEFKNSTTEELIAVLNIDNEEYTDDALELAKKEILERGYSHLLIPFGEVGDSLEHIRHPKLKDLVVRTSFPKIKALLESEFQVSFEEVQGLEALYSKLLFSEYGEESDITLSVVRIIHVNNPLRKDIQVLGIEAGEEEKFQLGLYNYDEWLMFKLVAEEVMNVSIHRYLLFCMFEILKGEAHQSEEIVSMDLEEHIELEEDESLEKDPADEDKGFSFKKLFGLK